MLIRVQLRSFQAVAIADSVAVAPRCQTPDVRNSNTHTHTHCARRFCFGHSTLNRRFLKLSAKTESHVPCALRPGSLMRPSSHPNTQVCLAVASFTCLLFAVPCHCCAPPILQHALMLPLIRPSLPCYCFLVMLQLPSLLSHSLAIVICCLFVMLCDDIDHDHMHER